MKLAIVGSHVLTDEQWHTANQMVLVFVAAYWDQPEFEVVSGGAEGVDSMAASAASTYGVPLVEFLPEVSRWEDHEGRKGYRTRNMEITDYCTHLLCIRTKDSKTYGSGWTADLAEKRGRVVWRYYV